jgi:hypothetical protein
VPDMVREEVMKIAEKGLKENIELLTRLAKK